MADLPVREMILYKHGVGFFVRHGEVSGTEVALTFRAEEVNDILKSLVVIDTFPDGKVNGVHYQTPMDRAHRLANTSIQLGNNQSVTQLFQQLRGRQVMLVVEDKNGKQLTHIGRVIGTEQQTIGDISDITGKHFVSLLTNDGATHIFPFDSLRQFTIKDEQSQQDLTYFLDTSMTEDNRRSVLVRLSDGEHRLHVSYVAPSPTWRVSYRLVAQADDDKHTGKALLQGWGLFDNRLEEDLNDVKVTLVAGQPISFIYDLYESTIPERPVVKDEARIVQAPVEYRAERPAAKLSMAHADVNLHAERRSRLLEDDSDRTVFMDSMAYSGASIDSLEQSTAVSAEARETGETFQYSVTTPVTVKRGESALVPILGHTVNYERELLYNRDKLPDHPVASLRFENQTGLTLERGPVTLVEDGDYKGEAIIPFTKDKNAVYVPYAVELGVNVKEEFHPSQEIHGLAISNEYLRTQSYRIHRTLYTIENTTDSDKVVTIEAPKLERFDLFDTRQPDAETLNEQRWKVSVPASETVKFERKQRQMQWQNKGIRSMGYHELDRYLDNRYIDNALIDELRELLDMIQSVNDMNQHIQNFGQERETLYSKQDQLRKNMGSLGTSGKEGTLRQRVVDQLEDSQDRLEAIEREIVETNATIEKTQQQITDTIAQLGDKYPAEG